MKKRKCPVCGSQRTSESKDYITCNNCPWMHKKTNQEKKNG